MIHRESCSIKKNQIVVNPLLAVNFEDISKAIYRVRDGVQNTSCAKSTFLSSCLGMEAYLKKDYRQMTGRYPYCCLYIILIYHSFKERGARNALMLLSKEEKKRGVIAASAGNHALALAYHGKLLNIPVTCVMPTIAPLTKITNCRDLGANVVLSGDHILEARTHADKLGVEQVCNLVHLHG